MIEPLAKSSSRKQLIGMVNSWSGGTCAEQVAVPAGELALCPRLQSMEEAAATPLAALTALQALRDLLDVRPGDRVTINGASGGVGLFAVQIASLLGGTVVDRIWPLEDSAEAHAYLETRRARGKVVLTVGRLIAGRRSRVRSAL